MAKRKATPTPPAETNPPAPSSTVGPILSMKGREEWSEWLTELAEWCRTDRVGVIDRAVTELAKSVEFRRPPRRL
jgi:hypothetical protein